MRAAIEHIALERLAFPLATPFRAAIRAIDSVDILLVRISAGGLQGVGYAFAFGAQDLAPIHAVAQGLVPVLTGHDSACIERCWGAMHHHLALLGAGGPALAALSAMDIALWDLLGKQAQLPLVTLLGGAKDAIPVYGSGGSLSLAPDQLLAEAQEFAAQGYSAYKFKAGWGLSKDVERLAVLREGMGPQFKLIVDGNQQWTEKQAIQVARQFAPFDLWWLEEPVAAHDLAACARVRAMSPMNIATGETNFGLHEGARLMTEQACDVLMPNLQRIGGITGWLKLAAMAQIRGLQMASHVYAEVGVHLLCAVPHGLTLEVLPWWPRLFVEPLRVFGGLAYPPAQAGLGLTVDEVVIRKHRY